MDCVMVGMGLVMDMGTGTIKGMDMGDMVVRLFRDGGCVGV